MKKRSHLPALLILSCAALLLGGCGSSEEKKEKKEETQAQTEAAHVITGYLITDADKYVRLGALEGLSVAHPVYDLTDAEVQYEIENMLYEYAEAVKVDRGAQPGDTVTMRLKAVVEGESEPYIDEEGFSYELGYEEFGTEFDEQVAGHAAGDVLSFSVSFTEDTTYNEDWVDKAVQFDITVDTVEETVIPEYTDDFAKNLGFASKEEFEEAMREQLTASHAAEADQETLLNALNAVMEESTFSGYPDQLYDSVSEEIRSSYESFAAQFGMAVEELYSEFGLSEESLKEEILDSVNKRLLVSAICNKASLSLTDEEYVAYVTNLAETYRYEGVDDLVADYGKSALVWEAYTNKAAGYIVLNAELYDAPVSADDGMMPDDDFDDGEIIELDDGSLDDDSDFFYFDEDGDEYEEETEA